MDTANERVLTEVGDGLIGQRMIHDSRIMTPDSFGVVNCPGLSDDRDLDLSRELKLILNPLGAVLGQPDSFFVGNLVTSDHDSDFTTSLESKRLETSRQYS